MFTRSFLLAALCSLGIAHADVLQLKNGTTVKGDLQSADANELRVKVGDATKNYPVAEVTSITFEARVTAVPAGTVVIRTVDAIDSKTSQVGQTFRASLDEALNVGGVELPRGAEAVLRLTEARSAGKLKGSAELTIALVAINAGGKTYEVNTESVSQESEGKGKGSAVKVGVGTGVGAAVGGLFGGKRGAAVGAGAGAAVGTAVALTTGPQVKIPSETRLSFKVQ
jgi:hypothetical protein